MLINDVIALEPKKAFSSPLRIISQTYQWTWNQLPLMLRFTELSGFTVRFENFLPVI